LAQKEKHPMLRIKQSVTSGLAVLLAALALTGFGLAPARTAGLPPAGYGRPAAATLLHTTLEDPAAITAPAVGVGGASTLPIGDFVPARVGNGARFLPQAQPCHVLQYVSFPATNGSAQNVELDRGELEFWYRPNYNAGYGDAGHTLIYIGADGYNPPYLHLVEGDELSLSLVEADWTVNSTAGDWNAPLWNAGEWVHLRASWDAADPTDSLRLYVNDNRVDNSRVAGGWSLGPETADQRIFVGSRDTCGSFIADGIIDELIIRDAPQPPAAATPTPTLTRTPTPTATTDGSLPTATRTATATVTRTATPTATSPSAGVGITDPNRVVTPAALPLQPAGARFVDPVFGLTLRRVSDTSDSGGFETHEYSQLQAFSSDNAYLLLTGSQGYLVRRVSDLSPVAGLDTSDWNAARWYPPQPHTIIHFDSNADTTIRLQLTSVDAQTTTTIFTFPAPYQRIVANRSSDELSEDGRWLAGVATRGDGAWVIFALDTVSRTLGAQIPVPDLYTGPCQPDPQWGPVMPDWVGVSPLGRYLVVQWTRDGTARCSGLETFDLQSGAFIGRVYDGHQHGDLGVDADGVTEFFMTFELAAPPPNNDRPAIGLRRLPGSATASPPTYLQVLDWGNSEHISCRGPNGACLVTAGAWDVNGWTAFEGELFLQYTDGRVLRLAHHRSSSCGYWVAPRASISRDGRYVVFASDWGRQLDCDDLGRGDPYIVDLLAALPAGCSPDTDGDGLVNILDIQRRAAELNCRFYLPLIVQYWRRTWPEDADWRPPTADS
jgi:hypothetical protein